MAFPISLLSVCGLLTLAGSLAAQPNELRNLATGHFEALTAATVDANEQAAVELGRSLFWDPRISASGKTSCASCHLAETWGADQRRFSVRDSGKLTGRNSQTVFNATRQETLRWVGDRKSAAHQAERSITGSLGHESPEAATRRLAELGYAERFKQVFAEAETPLSVENFGRAVEAYEQTLVTPAPFDRFLAGDDEALSDQQQRGLKLFIDIGCADCHDGELLGGNHLEKFGVFRNYWSATGSKKIDEGRYLVTQQETDKYHFRVAMLRNIARTGPYFHDGSVDQLTAAVRVMGTVQLGQELKPEQQELLVRFLESLTGEIPGNYSAPDGK